jgi:hypothetical protein
MAARWRTLPGERRRGPLRAEICLPVRCAVMATSAFPSPRERGDPLLQQKNARKSSLFLPGRIGPISAARIFPCSSACSRACTHTRRQSERRVSLSCLRLSVATGVSPRGRTGAPPITPCRTSRRDVPSDLPIFHRELPPGMRPPPPRGLIAAPGPWPSSLRSRGANIASISVPPFSLLRGEAEFAPAVRKIRSVGEPLAPRSGTPAQAVGPWLWRRMARDPAGWGCLRRRTLDFGATTWLKHSLRASRSYSGGRFAQIAHKPPLAAWKRVASALPSPPD